MGIAGFQKWLEQHYPHCFIPVPDAPRRPAPGERCVVTSALVSGAQVLTQHSAECAGLRQRSKTTLTISTWISMATFIRWEGTRRTPVPACCVSTRDCTLQRFALSRFRRAANEEQLFTLLFRELDGLFKVCVARQSIFIAVDGPGTRTHGHCLWCAAAA
jgi:hypothetical protein